MMEICRLLEQQRAFFERGETKRPAFRKRMLQKLKDSINRHEPQLLAALKADLNKAEAEAYMTEVGIVLEELRHAIWHVVRWSQPRRVRTPLSQFPAKSVLYHEPYGVTLILSPWNYPFQLALAPLVGALAAGNCAIVKPSAYAPATAEALTGLLADCFPPEYVAVVQGGRAQNADLLAQKFDYIFFTGGITVGKLVMQAAAEHLTPVTLELGGKSPCIVDRTANLPLAAKRIAFGKFLNAGQTCVAPDYVLVEESVKASLIEELRKCIVSFFGAAPLTNPELPKIINDKHFARLLGLMEGETAAVGGGYDPIALRIEPTVLENATFASPVMGEEIFGPILPVLSFQSIDSVIGTLLRRPRPLALYLFSEDKAVQQKVLRSLPFGGGCLNDTVIHLATSRLPFGGVGDSGMGQYHGKASFDTFSHTKSVVQKSTRIDLPMRYHPYTEQKLRAIRRFLG